MPILWLGGAGFDFVIKTKTEANKTAHLDVVRTLTGASTEALLVAGLGLLLRSTASYDINN